MKTAAAVVTGGWRSWGMGAVALAAGLISAWAVRAHVQGRVHELEEQARVPLVTRVVAAYDLAAGTPLDDAYVATRKIPAQWAASGSLDPDSFARLAGGVLAAPLKRGDPILAIHLKSKPQHIPLSAQLEAGRRAVTMPVDEINALSGMLLPGDLIDLYVSFPHGKRRVTAPLLQGLKVLATGRRSQEGDVATDAYSTVTLDASPEDAVKLVAARQAGSLTAILRHRNDGQTASAAMRGDLAGLLGLDDSSSARGPVVPVLYGDQLQSALDTQESPPLGETGDGIFQARVPARLSSSAGKPELRSTP